jgi:hypothetical protein
MTPLLLDVQNAPVPFYGYARAHVVYELRLTNFSSADVLAKKEILSRLSMAPGTFPRRLQNECDFPGLIGFVKAALVVHWLPCALSRKRVTGLRGGW